MEKDFFALAEKLGENPRLFLHVTDLDTKSKKFMLITDQSLWYTRKIDHLKHAIHPWLLISKLDKTEDSVSIIFGENAIKFETDKVDEIFEILWDILPRILRPTELISLGYFTDPDERPSPTPNSVLIRLNLKQRKKTYSAETINRIHEILEFSEEFVDLSSFSNPSEAFPIFFDLLPLCVNIVGLKISSSEKIEVYKVLRDNITEPTNIEYLEIEGQVTHHFDSFLRKLSTNKAIPISGITFTNSNFSEKNLLSISKCYIDKYLCSIGLHNAINPSSLISLYTTFLPKLCDKLTVLSLDHTQNLDLTQITQEFPNLEMLSFKNCDLEIYDILKFINRTHFIKLRGLDVSYNKCTRLADGIYDFPPALITIIAAGVNWPAGKLTEFFKIITIGDTQRRIDMSAILSKIEEIQKFYEYIKDKNIPQLKALVWDENILNADFFSFILQNPQIEYLSINFSLNETQNSEVCMLQKFVEQSNVRTLSIQGNDKIHLGKLLIPVIESCSMSKSIEYLNLEGSYCGDIGLIAAKKLLASENPLCLLNIDGICPKDPRSLFSFMHYAAGCDHAVAVSYPQNDISELIKDNKITDVQLNWLKNILKHPQPTIKETASPLESPFEIFKDNWKPHFPLYLKPLGPSPDGIKTEDMFNTDGLSDERTQLTISVDGDEIKLVPLKKDEIKQDKLTKSEENIRTLETNDVIPQNPETKKKTSDTKKGVKKKRIIKKKRGSSSVEKNSKSSTNKASKSSQNQASESSQNHFSKSSLNQFSKSSQNQFSKSSQNQFSKSSSPVIASASEVSTSEKSSSRKKSRTSKHSSHSSRNLSKSSSRPVINLESSTPMRDSSILFSINDSKEEFVWDFPGVCKMNCKEVVEGVFNRAEEIYEINTLTELIPK